MNDTTRRLLYSLLATAVLLVAVAAGAGAWRLAGRGTGPDSHAPQISVYSSGRTVRVGPYLSCSVDLSDCRIPGVQGQLPGSRHSVVQLSVDPVIRSAPWRLLRVYEDPDDTTVTVFSPNSTQSVTVESEDPFRGRLSGLVVQLPTLVRDAAGGLHERPHAEWSVRLDWS